MIQSSNQTDVTICQDFILGHKITTNFCTCHNSNVVMTWAKLCSDQLYYKLNQMTNMFAIYTYFWWKIVSRMSPELDRYFPFTIQSTSIFTKCEAIWAMSLQITGLWLLISGDPRNVSHRNLVSLLHLLMPWLEKYAQQNVEANFLNTKF